jgi:hypothetical protein
MAGMPKKGSPGTMEAGLTDYDYMPTIPGKRYGYKTLKGMPDTRQLNGGWGADHPGNIENQNKTKSLLQKKRDSFIQDPQDRRNQGKMKMDETDNVPGFLKDKLSRNGSLSTASTGLCLEGEEDGVIPPDGTFYGIKKGKRGWYEVSQSVVEAKDQAKEEVPTVSGGMFAWDPATKKMGPGGAMVGREWIQASGTNEVKSDGSYWLRIVFNSNGGASASVVTEDGGRSDVQCHIPIYRIVDGKIDEDFRGAFVVPCWE